MTEGGIPAHRQPSQEVCSLFALAHCAPSHCLPQCVITRVPAALDPRPLTVWPASTPGLCIKATVCPAVERASTLTMGSAKVPLLSLRDFPITRKGFNYLYSTAFPLVYIIWLCIYAFLFIAKE